MTYLKNYSKYIFFFFLIFFSLILFGSNNTDIIWNYGMAHAIRIGEIPFKDFNIITTSLYSFIVSLFLQVKDSYTVFLIVQSLLCTFLIMLVDKIIPGRERIFIFFMFFPIFYFIFPNYNFLVFFFLVLIIYLEEKKANDYLIGIILGLLILSKHTIGLVILCCSLISTFNFKKSSKRFISVFVVLLIYLIYLIVTKSLLEFLDLSILGLFDFSNTNKYYSVFYIIFAGLILIYLFYSFVFDKSYLNYYLLGSFTFIIPINDMFHFNYLFCFFIFILLIKYKVFKNCNYVFSFLIVIIFLLNIIINLNLFSNMKVLDNPYFDSYIVSKERAVMIKNILDEYQSFDNSYMLSKSSMFFDIASNHKITYFDIPLYGNFGYNGINKMKKKISNMHNTYFFLEDDSNRQYVNILNDYVRKIGKKVKDVELMEIYYIE